MLLSLLFHDDGDSLVGFFQNSLKKSPVVRVDEDQFTRSVSLLSVVAMNFCDDFANIPGTHKIQCNVRLEDQNAMPRNGPEAQI